MPHFRATPVRIILGVILLVLVGVAAYQIRRYVWASRQYQAASQALERYDYARAGVYLDNYLSFHPTDTEALLLAAQTSRRRGDFREARRRLELAERHGAPADALETERQLARLQGGDQTNAGRLMRFCVENPDKPETALILEVLFEGSLRALNLARAQWAVSLWLSHRTGNADQAHGLVWLGRIHEFSQDFPQALVAYRQAVELDPESARARLRLVEVLVREDPPQAVEPLQWLSKHRPDDPEVRLQMARLSRNLGRPEEAGHSLDEVLAATPDNVPALLERGRVAMDRGQPDEGERYLRHALTLAPEQRDVNLALGDCLRQSGRLDEAQRFQEKVREIDARLAKTLAEMTRKVKAEGEKP